MIYNTMRHLKVFEGFVNETKNQKFTFKTERPTGKWKSFSATWYYIKLDGKEVGSIGEDKPHKIRLMVVKDDINSDGNPNCPWKWITLKKESETMDAAKEWLNNNIAEITTKWKLSPLAK